MCFRISTSRSFGGAVVTHSRISFSAAAATSFTRGAKQRLVGFRRLVRAADLAHELQGGGADLGGRRRRSEFGEGADVAAHAETLNPDRRARFSVATGTIPRSTSPRANRGGRVAPPPRRRRQTHGRKPAAVGRARERAVYEDLDAAAGRDGLSRHRADHRPVHDRCSSSAPSFLPSWCRSCASRRWRAPNRSAGSASAGDDEQSFMKPPSLLSLTAPRLEEELGAAPPTPPRAGLLRPRPGDSGAGPAGCCPACRSSRPWDRRSRRRSGGSGR